MSEEQIEETFEKDTEEPVTEEVEEAVAVAAADLAATDGYPAETTDGTIVRITEKRGDAQNQVLVDADGNEYTSEPHHGQLVPLQAA